MLIKNNHSDNSDAVVLKIVFYLKKILNEKKHGIKNA